MKLTKMTTKTILYKALFYLCIPLPFYILTFMVIGAIEGVAAFILDFKRIPKNK